MILLIDNYDSFTYNLVHYLGELGAETDVRRNDSLNVNEALALGPKAIVLSPGPCDPDDAGICLDLVKAAAPHVPILGVCLGHEAIGQVYGGKIVRAPSPMHGKVSPIRHKGDRLFEGLPQDFLATRYHSLIVDRESLPEELEVTAETADGIVMAVSHKTHNVHGVQFHPESIASEHGKEILMNFLRMAKAQ
ncbi:anthranilate synthase component II [Neomegalonema perideroedes]|uniref:anthranilate synthase component II n=1 Tax=Neomegalonema perideroedes TaxID=217219 RepID=UPI000475EB50|nr:aminodeoxychorismate/anthranilate synthase component II [Neomegalonema perideroedes]